LRPHPALRQFGEGERVGLTIDHRGQHRADTVFRLDATEDNFMETSSNISSNRTISRNRSPINGTR
jgi:hypothetical protein